MDPAQLVQDFSISLFFLTLLALYVGRRLGRRWYARADAAAANTGVVEAAVFGLLGLIVAFMFGAAAARFEGRRQLIVDEANAIGTAYLRLDLLPARYQAEMRAMFRDYLDTRLRAYEALPDRQAAFAELAKAERQGKVIWERAVPAAREEGWTPATILLLPAINEMLDLAAARTAATRAHVPALVIALLFSLVLVGGLLAGFSMSRGAKAPLLHVLVFALAFAFSTFVVMDLELPRFGLIRLEVSDQALRAVRESMR
jgi:hypothetical protein